MQERGPVAPVNAGGQRYALVGGVAANALLRERLRERNSGGAFGLGSGVVPMVVLAVIALVVVLFVLGRSVDRPSMAVALGLVLGGALGNLGDRLFRSPGFGRGSVIDFVDLRWWPVFNVADAAITCGCVVLILLSFRRVPAESDS